MKTVEQNYQDILKKLGMDESKMGEVQRSVMRDLYFGCWGQAIFILRDEVGALPEKEAIVQMENFLHQIETYFINRLESEKNKS